jgi:hypothetical protein
MSCIVCGSDTHRDDAMDQRCNSCEHKVRQCICASIQKRGIVTKITPARYVRKPFYVEAIEVTTENLDEVAEWCSGTVVRSLKDAAVKGSGVTPYIQVQVLRPMNERQTKAYPGDMVLQAGASFKVYSGKAFQQSFDPVYGFDPVSTDESLEAAAQMTGGPIHISHNVD